MLSMGLASSVGHGCPRFAAPEIVLAENKDDTSEEEENESE